MESILIGRGGASFKGWFKAVGSDPDENEGPGTFPRFLVGNGGGVS